MAAPSAPSVLAARLRAGVRLRHLHVFLKAAELGSINRAAEAVGLTQPSASQVIFDLENMLECQLFDRHARGVRLTSAALALLPLVRRILETVDSAADAAAAINSSASGIVRVATIASGATSVLARQLPLWSQRFPEIQVQVREGEIDAIAQWMIRREVDMSLCRRPAVLPEGHVFDVLEPDEFVVACGPQHVLAQARQLRIEDLWSHTWMDSIVGTAPRTMLDQLAAEVGRPPTVCRISTRSLGVVLAMVQSQPLLVLLPRSFVSQMVQAGQLVLLDLQRALPFEPIGVLGPAQDTGAAAQAFRQFLIDRSSHAALQAGQTELD